MVQNIILVQNFVISVQNFTLKFYIISVLNIMMQSFVILVQNVMFNWCKSLCYVGAILDIQLVQNFTSYQC